MALRIYEEILLYVIRGSIIVFIVIVLGLLLVCFVGNVISHL